MQAELNHALIFPFLTLISFISQCYKLLVSLVIDSIAFLAYTTNSKSFLHKKPVGGRIYFSEISQNKLSSNVECNYRARAKEIVSR